MLHLISLYLFHTRWHESSWVISGTYVYFTRHYNDTFILRRVFKEWWNSDNNCITDLLSSRAVSESLKFASISLCSWQENSGNYLNNSGLWRVFAPPVQCHRWRGDATGTALDLRSTNRGFKSSGQKLRNNLGQVVQTYVPLSQSSITWYRPRGGDAVRLGW